MRHTFVIDSSTKTFRLEDLIDNSKGNFEIKLLSAGFGGLRMGSTPTNDTFGPIMIFCKQVSTNKNFYNGRRSTLLGNIPLSGIDRDY